MSFLNKYSICVLFGLMALTHFIVTQTTFLTPWKGGGYGMYSDYHPINYDIWIETIKGRFLIEELIEEHKEQQNLIAICKSFPSEFHLSKLNKFIVDKGHEPVKIEVWRPNFDLETKEYSKVLVAKYEN